MGFEDSMIEDGFHDEEEYLEHLMDEAENEWERQQNIQYSQEEEECDEYYDEDDEEYYSELREQYKTLFNEDPLKYKIFHAWVNYEDDRDYQNENYILNKFEEWQRDEEWHMGSLRGYYGDFFPRILKFYEWQIANPIEEILRQPHIEYFYPIDSYPFVEEIPERDLLVEEVENFENWIKNKKDYEQWFSQASDAERKDFLDMVNDNEFNNDTSIVHVRECIVKQMEEEKELDSVKERVLTWFDEDCERGKKLFYTIKCVQNYFPE